MQSNTIGPVLVFHVESLTTVSDVPSAYSIVIWKSSRGVARQGVLSKSQASREWQLNQPLPSITPTAFAPGFRVLVTSFVTYSARLS